MGILNNFVKDTQDFCHPLISCCCSCILICICMFLVYLSLLAFVGEVLLIVILIEGYWCSLPLYSCIIFLLWIKFWIKGQITPLSRFVKKKKKSERKIRLQKEIEESNCNQNSLQYSKFIISSNQFFEDGWSLGLDDFKDEDDLL